MSASFKNPSLLCEQCGQPLLSRTGEGGCLHCLLQAGLAPLETASPSPAIGAPRFYQHYEILTRPDGSLWELGRGAMGVTYKARDINLQVPVALKVIASARCADPGTQRRFLREARAAAQLRHPDVASVFHFGTINALPSSGSGPSSAEDWAEMGDCFYAMEFVEGETLEARLRRLGPLTPVTALEVALQVARALGAAEKCGLVHRDLKPSNIMLLAGHEENTSAITNSGEAFVKVIDFGLAKALEEQEEGASAKFFGTPAFSSPEQARGAALDIRSDVYSLGSTIWYSLTGTLPFPESFRRGVNGSEQPLPTSQLRARGIPSAVIALLAKMLAPDAAARPRPLELTQAIERCLDRLRGNRRSPPTHRLGAAAAALGLAAGLVALAFWFFTSGQLSDDKSIAILPFQNLSEDVGDTSFAEGIEDDLLSTLAKIRDLKVISRLSVSRYPANEPRNLREIGRALGVRHVLEGRLRRTDSRVLLNVALIDTEDGHERWAERYDRTMADAITLQADLANAIATALDATLTKREKADVQAKPTGNPDAYILYLRGRKFDNSPTIAIGDYEAAAALYSQAIALDPGFALAHARRGATLAFLYRFRGPSEELKQEAHAEIAEALRLNPKLAEAHLDKGLSFYRIERDFDRALPELEIAQRLLPNDTEAASFLAYIERRRGKWREARDDLERIRQRDPRNAMYAEELYTTAYLLRDWPTARKHIREAEAMIPNLTVYKVELAMVDLWQNGDLRALRQLFADLKGYGDPEGSIAWSRWDSAMVARDYPAARAALDSFPGDTLPSAFAAPLPKSYMEGCIALAQGHSERAQQLFEAARPVMEAESIAHPQDALRHTRLGLLYAYMGRKKDALREGERAVALNPAQTDAFEGMLQLCNLALIHARVGDNDRAVSMIESLLRRPGAVFFSESSMTLPELRLRWQWDPLRNDPAFQKILAGPEPATIY